jgi:hypothetical protein
VPTLAQDLAAATSAFNVQVALRLDEEARDLNRRRTGGASPAAPGSADTADALRRQAVESARQATDRAIAGVRPAEGNWRSAVAALCQDPLGADAERLLRSILDEFESGRRLVRSCRTLWDIAGQPGAAIEAGYDLDRTERRYAELAAEATEALENRQKHRQPADPDRLALGVRQAREGKTVSAEQAVARFQRG